MKAYFYIEARMVDDMVSFAHCPVNATDDDDAYLEGGRLMDSLRRMGLPSQGHFRGEFLNDYVIEVPGVFDRRAPGLNLNQKPR